MAERKTTIEDSNRFRLDAMLSFPTFDDRVSRGGYQSQKWQLHVLHTRLTQGKMEHLFQIIK